MTKFLVIKQSTCPTCHGESPTNDARCETCKCAGVVREEVPVWESIPWGLLTLEAPKINWKPDEPEILIETLGLSVRASRVLHRMRIVSLNELSKRLSSELLAMNNCGETTIHELRRMLSKHGMSFFNERRLNQPAYGGC